MNPLHTQIIAFEDNAKQRVTKGFEMLNQILHTDQEKADTDILLAYLNALLVELNSAYFKNGKPAGPFNANLSTFMEFKLMVETPPLAQA